jgi:hypothetical protein
MKVIKRLKKLSRNRDEEQKYIKSLHSVEAEVGMLKGKSRQLCLLKSFAIDGTTNF